MNSYRKYDLSLPLDSPVGSLASDYIHALLNTDRMRASNMIMEAVESGTSIKDIYLHVFQASQREIGRLWQNGIIGVAQEHYCSAATQLIMSQLYPHIFSTTKIGKRFVATCVSGELHEIGLRMVSDFFEMEGWDTYYIGANAPTQSIIEAIHEHNANLVGLSATMYFNVSKIKEIISSIQNENFNQSVKILVGGYPFLITKNLWKEVGADGFATDAENALQMANQLV